MKNKGKRAALSDRVVVEKFNISFCRPELVSGTCQKMLKRVWHNNRFSFGRSMVEMMGVLAIIGVLSIGGLAGYRVTINKHHANQIVQETRLAAMDILSRPSIPEGDIKLNFVPSSPLTVEGKLDGFEIIVSDIGNDVCQNILRLSSAMDKVKAYGVLDGDILTSTCLSNNTLVFSYEHEGALSAIDKCVGIGCSGHGTCDSATGTCHCESGWQGTACDEKICSSISNCASYTSNCLCAVCETGTLAADGLSCDLSVSCLSGEISCPAGSGSPTWCCPTRGAGEGFPPSFVGASCGAAFGGCCFDGICCQAPNVLVGFAAQIFCCPTGYGVAHDAAGFDYVCCDVQGTETIVTSSSDGLSYCCPKGKNDVLSGICVRTPQVGL